MEFVNPGFLFGLLAISVPVIIHLFNFRRFKKIYFSNVSFLRELKLQTQKQSRLKHLLILFLRILAIISIVLAFAQPYFPVSQQMIRTEDKNVVSIYLDNSFSMQAISEKGTLIDEAREKALEIAAVYKSSDIFQLLTNDLEGKDHRFISRDEFIERVNEIHASPAVRTLNEILSIQQKLLTEQSGNVKTSYIISDFQQSLLEDSSIGIDSSISVLLIPIKAISAENLYIDSCWFQSPILQMNQNAQLTARIRNSSEKNYERIPIRLTINDKQRALASFDIKANEATEVSMPYTINEDGIQSGALEIDDFSITFDDKLWFSYFVTNEVPILCINGNKENLYLNSLFEKDSLVRFTNVPEGNIAFTDFRKFRLIILNELSSVSSGLLQQLVPFVNEGGSIAIIPSAITSPQGYNEFLSTLHTGNFGNEDTANTKISTINLEHPLYDNVFDEIPENIDLPVVYSHYPIQFDTRTLQEPLLKLLNGETFLNVFQVEKGKVYLFAVPFDPSYSNFPKHAIFVPTLYKMAVSSILQENLYYTIGKNDVISLADIDLGNEEVLHLKGKNFEFDIIPEHRRTNSSLDVYVHQQILQAGDYEIQKDNSPVKGISFNYNRKESEMIFYTTEKLKEIIKEKYPGNVQVFDAGNKPFAETLNEFSKGISLWKLFVILALAFLLAEAIVLRLFK